MDNGSNKKDVESINGLGCQSTLGCVAGKRHFQQHEQQFASDINDAKEFKKEQEKENKKVFEKVSNVVGLMHDATKDLAMLLNKQTQIIREVEEEKKRIYKKIEEEKKVINDKIKTNHNTAKGDVKLIWKVFLTFLAISVPVGTGAFFAVNSSVGKVNKIDVQNQASTEAFFLLTISELSKKPVDDLMIQYSEFKKVLDIKKEGDE